MRKNKMMRAASALMVAVLLTTCTISGTFAKYVTTAEGSDTARVAKWGVVVEAENFDLFTDKYETDDTSFTGAQSVESSGSDKVLAPGTSGSFADIAITGTPEVAVDVKIEATVELSDNWIVDGDFYCPVVVTVGTTAISGLDYEDADDFVEAIEKALEDKSAQYAPNFDLSTVYDNTNLDLAWAWAFENGHDKEDTKLGDKAVAEDLTISIGVKITVEQID